MFFYSNKENRPSVEERIVYGPACGARQPLRLTKQACVLPTAQSLRHGFAVPPPFTQGRLWCGANLLDKFKLSISLTSRIVGAHCVRLLLNEVFFDKSFCSIT